MGAEAGRFNQSGAVSIEALFRGCTFEVPPFQRNYSWSTDQARDLWEDLNASFRLHVENGNLEAHDYESEDLLGAIVLINEPNTPRHFRIVDGQQRIATFTLLLNASVIVLGDRHDWIRELFEERNDMGARTSWRVSLNRIDSDHFENILNGEFTENDNNPDSARKLGENHNYFIQQLRKLPVHYRDIPNVTEIFMRHVLNHIFLIRIMAGNVENAYQIFERLNERGVELSKSDLVKNFLLGQLDEEMEEQELEAMITMWDDLFTRIIRSGKNDDEFIEESFNSRYRHARSIRPPIQRDDPISKKDVYAKVIESIRAERSYDGSRQFIEELNDDGNYLLEVGNPSEYNQGDLDHQADIIGIKYLLAHSIRIPILAANRRWGDDTDYYRLTRFLVRYFFNARTIRKEHPNEILNTLMECTRQINTETTDVENIIETIQNDYDNNTHTTFSQNLTDYVRYPKISVAKYVLRQIEKDIMTNPQDEHQLGNNFTLEHILPKRHETWDVVPFQNRGEMDRQSKRLGNMTLLTIRPNSAFRNSVFADKVTWDRDGNRYGYQFSLLELNQNLRGNVWGTEQIDCREEWLCEHIARIFDLRHE